MPDILVEVQGNGRSLEDTIIFMVLRTAELAARCAQGGPSPEDLCWYSLALQSTHTFLLLLQEEHTHQMRVYTEDPVGLSDS